MDTTIYIGLAHQMAMRRRMDIIAHNVANMNTTAFNKERVAFRQFLMDAGGSDASSGGKVSSVLDYGIIRNLSQGTFVPTGNDLDIAISGRGYLSVELPDGDTGYTRNGRMKVDKDLNLALLSGEKILDDTGKTITITPEDLNLHIANDGTLSSSAGELGKIGVYSFENEQAMERIGTSLYITDEDPLYSFEPAYIEESGNKVEILSGNVENSNVNALQSMTEMIKVQRAYQSFSRSLDTYQKMRSDSLDRLARVQ